MEFPLLVVLCRCLDQRFALPAAHVTRVLGAAQFVGIAGLGGCAVGIVNVAGVNLALCDVRVALGLASAELQPADHFVELESSAHGARRWLLWVEEVIGIISVTQAQCDALLTPEGAAVRHALRLPLESLPLLDLTVLEPSAVIGD